MLFNLYMIWDEDLRLWSPGFHQRSDNLAVKMTEKVILEHKATPENLKLFKIGSYDDENSEKPISLMTKIEEIQIKEVIQ